MDRASNSGRWRGIVSTPLVGRGCCGGGGSRAGHEILKRSSSSQKEGRFPQNRRNEFRNGKTSNGRTEDSLYLAKGSVEAAGEQVFALASLLACQLFF